MEKINKDTKLTIFWNIVFASAEEVIRKFSVIKMFYEILTNSQENTCAGVSFLIKLQLQLQIAGFQPAMLSKKRLLHGLFPANFAKSLRTPFFTENLFGCFFFFTGALRNLFRKTKFLIGDLSEGGRGDLIPDWGLS